MIVGFVKTLGMMWQSSDRGHMQSLYHSLIVTPDLHWPFTGHSWGIRRTLADHSWELQLAIVADLYLFPKPSILAMTARSQKGTWLLAPDANQ